MKKEILTHIAFLIAFLIPVVLLRGYYEISLEGLFLYGPLVLGAILGTILPDVDHLIYIYFLAPQELTSQRINNALASQNIPLSGKVRYTLELLYTTRGERKNLIFHTVYFQIIFWILAFLVLTSTASFFGKGLVLAYSLHLIVDQFIDLMKLGSLDNWFSQLSISSTKEKYMFWWIGNIVVLLLFSFVL